MGSERVNYLQQQYAEGCDPVHAYVGLPDTRMDKVLIPLTIE